MRCKNCGTEWSISIHGSSIQRFCPACGKPVFENTTQQVATLEEALFVIKRDYGIDQLRNNTRIMAYFSDLAPHLRKEKIMLQHLIQCNGNTLLIGALKKTPPDQQLCRRQLVSRLVEELFLSETAAKMICNSFWNAIASDKAPEKEQSPEELYNEACFCEKENIDRAMQLLTLSADAGYLQAQVKLAKWFYEGTCIKRNIQKALYLYKKAEKSEDPEVLYMIGLCYANSCGDESDLTLASKYYQKASDNGFVEAHYSLARLFDCGYGVPKDEVKAASLYEKAAKMGHVISQYCMGRCYEYGVGLTKDIDLAIYWYKKAALNGSAAAQYAMGMCYQFGYGFDQDVDIAYYWYKKAHDNGYAIAGERLDQLSKLPHRKQ